MGSKGKLEEGVPADVVPSRGGTEILDDNHDEKRAERGSGSPKRA